MYDQLQREEEEEEEECFPVGLVELVSAHEEHTIQKWRKNERSSKMKTKIAQTLATGISNTERLSAHLI